MSVFLVKQEKNSFENNRLFIEIIRFRTTVLSIIIYQKLPSHHSSQSFVIFKNRRALMMGENVLGSSKQKPLSGCWYTVLTMSFFHLCLRTRRYMDWM